MKRKFINHFGRLTTLERTTTAKGKKPFIGKEKGSEKLSYYHKNQAHFIDEETVYSVKKNGSKKVEFMQIFKKGKEMPFENWKEKLMDKHFLVFHEAKPAWYINDIKQPD